MTTADGTWALCKLEKVLYLCAENIVLHQRGYVDKLIEDMASVDELIDYGIQREYIVQENILDEEELILEAIGILNSGY